MEILSLGEKIKRTRKELNMTLKDLAGDRITPGQISLVESGKSNPSMDLLEYLAVALNTSVEYLMESEETQAEKICTYYENIAESYILNKDFYLGEQYIEKAFFYAEKYNLDYRKAKISYLRASIYMNKGEMTIAQQFFLSANVIFIKENRYEEIINTFVNLGKITLKLKAYHSSASYFQQAEKVYIDNNIGNDFLLGEIYYNMANVQYALENIGKAIDYSFLAKEKFKQINDRKSYASTLLMISEQYNKKGDIDNAIKYSKKTLALYKEIKDEIYVAQIENNLGKLFYQFDNIEESFIHLNKAKEIRRNIKDSKLIETLVNICENYIKLKDVKNAKTTLDEIIESMKDGDNSALIQYYLLKYRVHMLQGDLKEAESSLLLALNFVKNINYLKEAAEISIMIGKFYIDYGRESEAVQYLNYGVEVFKKLGIIKEC
ncbi:tetratricopeptide repeat protein [uncultured Clostridium sp.]|uniref:helix-turn-helix domain-containing protein n=1 Tax=uncultured Clostridium sp. TaxID=59620 RepID=UPI0028E1DC1F|nr:tetratricopeptide repeat protein [uncultured Clostridium sp.]